MQRDGDDERDRRPEPAEHGEHREVEAAHVHVPRPAVRAVQSGCVDRSRITETCAIVNDSIAPNAYMSPRNSALPGSRVTIAAPPNTRIPIHGVRKRGCKRRSASGSWRWMPIE